jgi:hypothetical protein
MRLVQNGRLTAKLFLDKNPARTNSRSFTMNIPGAALTGESAPVARAAQLLAEDDNA